MGIVLNDFKVVLTEFYSKGENIVDVINFLYDGNLWPHTGVKRLSYTNMQTHFYQTTGLGLHRKELRIGTICHENGHLLCRFPDLYDYGKRDGDFEKSQGIGRYCLMSSGNNLDGGLTPAPVCGLLRELAGWVDNISDLNKPGRYALGHSDYDSIGKFKTDKPNEYFVIENRSKLGLNRALPSSGLGFSVVTDWAQMNGRTVLEIDIINAHYSRPPAILIWRTI